MSDAGTSRPVALRPFESGDRVAVHRWMSDPSVTTGLVNARPTFSLTQADAWVSQAIKQGTADRKWVICRHGQRAPLGFTALYGLNGGVAPQFAIVVGEPAARGHGVGRTASQLTLRVAFEELEQRRVYLEVLSSNGAAIRLYEGLGFQLEGRLREHVDRGGEAADLLIYGLLRGEWHGGQAADH